jgi:hypothetical protein
VLCTPPTSTDLPIPTVLPKDHMVSLRRQRDYIIE